MSSFETLGARYEITLKMILMKTEFVHILRNINWSCSSKRRKNPRWCV